MLPAPTPLSPRPGEFMPRAAVALASLSCMIACLAFVGWMTGNSRLASWLPHAQRMHWSTTAAVIVLSLGVFFRRRGVMQAVALFSLGCLVVVVLLALILGGAWARIAPETLAAIFCCAAMAWGLTRGWSNKRLTFLCTAATVICAVVSIGYLYGVPTLYQGHRSIAMALPSAIAVLLLSWALAVLAPDGFANYFWKGTGPDAQVMRWMVPLLMLVFPLSGAAMLWAFSTTAVSSEQIVLVGIVSCCVITLLVLFRLILMLGRTHRSQRRAAEALSDLNNQLIDGRDKAWQRAEDVARELKEEKTRFDETLGRLEDMVFSVRVLEDGWEVLYSTTQGEALIGVDVPGEQVVRALHERVHPDDVHIRAELWKQTLLRGEAGAELRVIGLDDVERWIWVRTHAATRGDATHVDGIVTNITERRRWQDRQAELLELETQQVLQLRRLSSMRDEFMAIAGHELRTPLAAVQGYCELILDEDISDDVRRYATVIANRSFQLNALVEDFFDLAKLNLGKGSLHPSRLDVGELLDDVIDGHLLTAQDQGISLTRVVEAAQIDGDEVRLRQCLDNLISNALKYNRPEGSVVVQGHRAGGHYVVSVADTGVGIDAEQIPYVFDAFFRTEKSDTSAITGIGLGLSLTRALVEMHGGTIEVDSQLGEGTTFVITLPTAPAAAEA